jgi:hypothetical protein
MRWADPWTSWTSDYFREGYEKRKRKQTHIYRKDSHIYMHTEHGAMHHNMYMTTWKTSSTTWV